MQFEMQILCFYLVGKSTVSMQHHYTEVWVKWVYEVLQMVRRHDEKVFHVMSSYLILDEIVL